MKLLHVLTCILVCFCWMESAAQAQQFPTNRLLADNSGSQAELMQQKQMTMQELQLVLTERQSLQQQDMNAQQQQKPPRAPGALNSAGNNSVAGYYADSKLQSDLASTRKAIAEQLIQNNKREAQLRSDLRDIDSRLNSLK
jgi:hypothetical protein